MLKKVLKSCVAMAFALIGFGLLSGCISTSTGLSDSDVALIEGAVDRAVTRANEYTDQKIAERHVSVISEEEEEEDPIDPVVIPVSVVQREVGVTYLRREKSGNIEMSPVNHVHVAAPHSFMGYNPVSVGSDPFTQGDNLSELWKKERGTTRIRREGSGNIDMSPINTVKASNSFMGYNPVSVSSVSPLESTSITELWKKERGISRIRREGSGNIDMSPTNTVKASNSFTGYNPVSVSSVSPLESTSITELWKKEKGVSRVRRQDSGNIEMSPKNHVKAPNGFFVYNPPTVRSTSQLAD